MDWIRAEQTDAFFSNWQKLQNNCWNERRFKSLSLSFFFCRRNKNSIVNRETQPIWRYLDRCGFHFNLAPGDGLIGPRTRVGAVSLLARVHKHGEISATSLREDKHSCVCIYTCISCGSGIRTSERLQEQQNYHRCHQA